MSNFILNNILVAPSLVHNLISVRQFTRDNSCSIEFDASSFSVKELGTGRVILRCDSTGDLYTIPSAAPAPAQALLAASNILQEAQLPLQQIAIAITENRAYQKPIRSHCHCSKEPIRSHFSKEQHNTQSPFHFSKLQTQCCRRQQTTNSMVTSPSCSSLA
jgi:hypothetical protein